MNLVPEKAMANRGRPKTSERDDVTVRLDRGLISKAKVLAADESLSLAEYLSDMLRPSIDRAYAKLVKKIDEATSKSRVE